MPKILNSVEVKSLFWCFLALRRNVWSQRNHSNLLKSSGASYKMIIFSKIACQIREIHIFMSYPGVFPLKLRFCYKAKVWLNVPINTLPKSGLIWWPWSEKHEKTKYDMRFAVRATLDYEPSNDSYSHWYCRIVWWTPTNSEFSVSNIATGLSG